MLTMKHGLFKRTIHLVLLLLPIAASVAFVVPSPKAQAAAGDPLCYNKQAGSLPVICRKGTQIPADEIIGGKTHAQGAIFENNKCYTFADVNKGWEESSCDEDVFKQALRGTAPIAKADDPALTACTGDKCDAIAKILNPVINFLAAGVGIVAAISFAVGGIQYSASQDDPGKVAAAKGRIYNTIFGLGGFMFIWAFLQWLVPGGVF
jgi:hypothetical protein